MMYHYPSTCHSAYAIWQTLLHNKIGLKRLQMDIAEDGAEEYFDLYDAIQLATSIGDLALTMEIVKRGAKVKFALEWACTYGHLHIVKWLCSIYDPADDIYNDLAAVANASQNGHLKIIKWLYKKGFCLDWAVESASSHGHLHIVKWLYSKGCKLTSRTIEHAAIAQNVKLVKWLYARGCRFDGEWSIDQLIERDKNYYVPCHEMIELLTSIRDK